MDVRFVPKIANTKKEKQSLNLAKDLRPMMYGFGDDADPHSDSVALVESMTTSYLESFLRDCLDASTMAGSAKVRMEDVMFVLARKDKKKAARVEELLFMNEELKRARKAFEVDDGGGNDDY